MSLELVHSSVLRGLRGDSGFATAVATKGMPPALEAALAELSSYDFEASRSVGADRVEWAHRIVKCGSKAYAVLSRVSPCGNDASGRPNRVAHHLTVEVHERASAGPAWALSVFGHFAMTAPTVEERPTGPSLPLGEAGPRVPRAWEAAGLDVGWAGVVAATLLDFPSTVCYVVLPEEMDCLGLVDDVLALLPPERRWFVTFSTRPQRVPTFVTCQLRFVRAGASGLARFLNEPGVRKVTILRGQAPEPNPAAQAARAGTTVSSQARPAMIPRIEPVLRTTTQARETAPIRTTPFTRVGNAVVAHAPADVPRRPADQSSRSVPDVAALLSAAPRPGPVARDASPTPVLAVVLFVYSALALLIAFVLLLISSLNALT